MRLSYVSRVSYVYIWSAVDVDSRELLALEASYGRSSLNALAFLR
jgi:transposase-like protein